jgi:hypothetical protein
MFELVSDTEQADEIGNVHIINQPSVIEVIDDTTNENSDIYVDAGRYDSGSIKLHRSDNGVIDIDVTSLSDIASWYENNN